MLRSHPTDSAHLALVPSDAELYERVAPVVHRMVWLYLANDRDREDIAQDIFLSIMRGAGSLRDPKLIEAWAARVTFNAICNLFRRRKFRSWLSLDALEEEHEPECHPDFEGRELVVRAQRILESLPISERMPLTLELFGNVDQPEIARLCGCSERTVRRRIKAGRKHFLAVARMDPVFAFRLGHATTQEGATDE